VGRGRGVPRLLAALLGAAEPGDDGGLGEALEAVEAALEAVEQLPNVGPLARAREALASAREALGELGKLEARVRGASGLYTAHLSAIVSAARELEALLQGLLRLYRSLEDQVRRLHETVRAKVAAAMEEDMRGLEGVGALAAYLEEAARITAEMARLSSEAARVEEARRRLLEAIDALYSKLLGEQTRASVGSQLGEVQA